MIFGGCIGKNESTIEPTQFFFRNQNITMNEMMKKRIENKNENEFYYFFLKCFFFLNKTSS
jgi:hypothetical protein